jgi:hypothetical protein
MTLAPRRSSMPRPARRSDVDVVDDDRRAAQRLAVVERRAVWPAAREARQHHRHARDAVGENEHHAPRAAGCAAGEPDRLGDELLRREGTAAPAAADPHLEALGRRWRGPGAPLAAHERVPLVQRRAPDDGRRAPHPPPGRPPSARGERRPAAR